MTTDTDTLTDAPLREHLSRRHVLKLLGLVAATGRATASDGDVAVGGGGAEHDFRFGEFSTAPSNFPPEFDAGGWVQRDTALLRGGYSGSLPVTFSAAGVEWSLASDLATAKSNAGSGSAVAIGAGGGIDVGHNGGLPAAYSADGVTTVIASDVATAKGEVSAPPAIAAGSDGVEVLVDA